MTVDPITIQPPVQVFEGKPRQAEAANRCGQLREKVIAGIPPRPVIIETNLKLVRFAVELEQVALAPVRVATSKEHPGPQEQPI